MASEKLTVEQRVVAACDTLGEWSLDGRLGNAVRDALLAHEAQVREEEREAIRLLVDDHVNSRSDYERLDAAILARGAK